MTGGPSSRRRPRCSEHAVAGFGLYQAPSAPRSQCSRGSARPGRVGGGQPVRVLAALPSCRVLGMPEAKIQAIAYWGASDEFTEVERAVLACTDAGLALQGYRVHDALFAKRATPERRRDHQAHLHHVDVRDATRSRAASQHRVGRPRRPIVEVAGPRGFSGYDVSAGISRPTPTDLPFLRHCRPHGGRERRQITVREPCGVSQRGDGDGDAVELRRCRRVNSPSSVRRLTFTPAWRVATAMRVAGSSCPTRGAATPTPARDLVGDLTGRPPCPPVTRPRPDRRR